MLALWFYHSELILVDCCSMWQVLACGLRDSSQDLLCTQLHPNRQSICVFNPAALSGEPPQMVCFQRRKPLFAPMVAMILTPTGEHQKHFKLQSEPYLWDQFPNVSNRFGPIFWFPALVALNAGCTLFSPMFQSFRGSKNRCILRCHLDSFSPPESQALEGHHGASRVKLTLRWLVLEDAYLTPACTMHFWIMPVD